MFILLIYIIYSSQVTVENLWILYYIKGMSPTPTQRQENFIFHKYLRSV